MADHEDVKLLRRRGRRRLVGAIALVLLAVIVLPMVFDSEPRQAPPLSVRIPSEDDGAFAPRLTPKATPANPDALASEAKREPGPEAAGQAKSPQRAEAAAPEAKSAAVAAKAADKVPSSVPPRPDAAPQAGSAPKVAAGGAGFVVQVGAFKDDEKAREVVARLAAAGLPHYTEPVAIASGTAIRVRIGPYASRQAADEALRKVQALGFAASKVVGPSS